MQNRKNIAIAAFAVLCVVALAVIDFTGNQQWDGVVIGLLISAIGLVLVESVFAVRRTSVAQRRRIDKIENTLVNALTREMRETVNAKLDENALKLNKKVADLNSQTARYFVKNDQSKLSDIHRSLQSIIATLDALDDFSHRPDDDEINRDNSVSGDNGQLSELAVRSAYSLWLNHGGAWSELPYPRFVEVIRAIGLVQPKRIVWNPTALGERLRESGALEFLKYSSSSFSSICFGAQRDELLNSDDVQKIPVDSDQLTLFVSHHESISEILEEATCISNSQSGRCYWIFSSADLDLFSDLADYLGSVYWNVLREESGTVLAYRDFE